MGNCCSASAKADDTPFVPGLVVLPDSKIEFTGFPGNVSSVFLRADGVKTQLIKLNNNLAKPYTQMAKGLDAWMAKVGDEESRAACKEDPKKYLDFALEYLQRDDVKGGPKVLAFDASAKCPLLEQDGKRACRWGGCPSIDVHSGVDALFEGLFKEVKPTVKKLLSDAVDTAKEVAKLDPAATTEAIKNDLKSNPLQIPGTIKKFNKNVAEIKALPSDVEALEGTVDFAVEKVKSVLPEGLLDA